MVLFLDVSSAELLICRRFQVPIIFVTHSMGGLVFKKAFLDGSLDSHYGRIIDAVKAVIFLSTPHRGSNMAGLLNKILSTTPLISQKQYVTELMKNWPFIKAINEQFRHIAPKLQIFSFYETLKTSIGLTSTVNELPFFDIAFVLSCYRNSENLTVRLARS